MVDRLYKEVASVVAEQLLAPDRYYDSRHAEERRRDAERRAQQYQGDYSPSRTASSSSRAHSQSSYGRDTWPSRRSSRERTDGYFPTPDREFNYREFERRPPQHRGHRFEPYDRRSHVPGRDDRRGRDTQPRQRGRAQEDRLRRVAQQSRGQRPLRVEPPVQRTVFPPDSSEAAMDADNLPQFPVALTVNESADPLPFGLPKDWVSVEDNRRGLSIGREQSGDSSYERAAPVLSQDTHGDWAEAVSVRTVSQARDLMRWAAHGQTHAMAFIRDAIITRLSSDPTLLRSPGEIMILTHQNTIWDRYRAAAPGVTVPRAKEVHRLPRPVSVSQGLTYELGGPAPRSEGSSLDTDEIPFLASSVPTAGSLISLTENISEGEKGIVSENAHAFSTTDLVGWFSSILPKHWPKGVRMHNSVLPSADVVSAVPHQGDVRAWMTLNALAPIRERSSHHRSRFLDFAVRLLSVRGLFGRYVEGGGYVVAALPLEHYPFVATNVSFAQVAAWLAQHGVDPSSPATHTIEEFARIRRLVQEHGNSADLTSTVFKSFPFGPAAAVNLKVYDEELWSNLRHGTVRGGKTTSYPQHPGAQDVVMEEATADAGSD